MGNINLIYRFCLGPHYYRGVLGKDLLNKCSNMAQILKISTPRRSFKSVSLKKLFLFPASVKDFRIYYFSTIAPILSSSDICGQK